MGSRSPEEFSVLVLASDLGIDARPFLDAQAQIEEQDENWHDCSQYLSDEDFSDLDLLQFIRIQGSDKSGNRILRIVGKYLPGNYSFILYAFAFLGFDFVVFVDSPFFFLSFTKMPAIFL